MKDETFSSFIFTVSMLQDPPHLSYAVSFLPLARSSQMLDYYTNIKQEKLCDDTTEIVAMDLGECGLELATKVHEVFTIMEKAPLSWSPSSRTFVSSSIWGMFRIQDTAQNQACRCYWAGDRGNWELPVTLPLWCCCDTRSHLVPDSDSFEWCELSRVEVPEFVNSASMTLWQSWVTILPAFEIGRAVFYIHLNIGREGMSRLSSKREMYRMFILSI